MSRPSVTHLSETEFGFKWNGVHTAYLNISDAVRRQGDFKVRLNAPFGSQILHAHTFMGYYWAVRALHRGPVVLHAHAMPGTLAGQVRAFSSWEGAFTGFLRAYYNSADLVVCMTPRLQAEVKAMGVRTPTALLPLPLDLSAFRPDPAARARGRARLGLKPREFLVLGAGQVILRKGVMDFAELARRHPALRFAWIGEIPFSRASDGFAELKELQRNPPKNLSFPGVFPLSVMPEFFNAADSFLFPSRHETFGFVVAEAAACGLPLLLKDLPTYGESFGSSYLKAGDLRQFSAALGRLAKSAPLRSRLRQSSLKVARKFDPSAFGKAMAAHYHELLKSRTPS
jgi:1,2-diacylglycerol-3-alpha-glucose alpha-1,2-galactosyltransferase